jgi:PKD repeat protein
VSVLSPSNVVVSTGSTNSPVTEGEELSVAATVENTGDAATTQTISLSIGDTQRDSTTVTLDSGESAGINLSWTTESGDAGDYTATVTSADDTASTPVTVSGDKGLSASFDVNQSTILVGNAIRFNGSASTDPDGQITDYRWDFDGDGTTDATGRTVTRAFDSAGNYTVELTVIDNSINTDTVSRTITVESESNGTDVLTVASAPKTVAPDTTFNIDYTIRNADSQAASYTLNINDLPSGVTVDGFAGDIQSSSPEASPPATSTTLISPGDTATVTVTYRAEAGLSGDRSVGVEAVQPLSGTTDTASSVVAVQRPANHSLSVSTAPSTVVQDTEFEVTYTIENTASRTASYTLTGNKVPSGITVVSFSGDIQSSSLDTSPTATTDAIVAGSTGSVTITYQVAANVTGNKTVGLTATNPLEGTEDAASSTLTATEAPSNPEERALQIVGVSSPTELTQSDVTVAITKFNRGQTANGLTIKQNDVTVLITLFERD